MSAAIAVIEFLLDEAIKRQHAWLIDVVSPFEKAEPYVKACCDKFMAGKKVSRLVAGSETTRVEEVAGAAR